jgi:hypothetical protein
MKQHDQRRGPYEAWPAADGGDDPTEWRIDRDRGNGTADIIAWVYTEADASMIADALNRRDAAVALDERETGTVLAALRYWQAVGAPPARFVDIADDGGTLTPLDSGEIDALCERING